jgi:hypothetical protein
MSEIFQVTIKLFKLASNDSFIKFYSFCGILVLSIASYSLKRIKKRFREMRKLINPKDVVILHCLNKGFKIPHDKPEIMKLETFLRMSQIGYEVTFYIFYHNNYNCIINN